MMMMEGSPSSRIARTLLHGKAGFWTFTASVFLYLSRAHLFIDVAVHVPDEGDEDDENFLEYPSDEEEGKESIFYIGEDPETDQENSPGISALELDFLECQCAEDSEKMYYLPGLTPLSIRCTKVKKKHHAKLFLSQCTTFLTSEHDRRILNIVLPT